ncbi:MAG: CAP domain-containing protein [Candidatus Moraniibacteriota bacterium]
MINKYRVEQGQNPLTISVKLSKTALAMARDMGKHPESLNSQHLDSKGRDLKARISRFGYDGNAIENLAAGYKTAAGVFKAWKESESHRQNMLDSENKVMGLAKVKRGNDFGWYWSCIFGDEESSSDLLDETNYAPMKKLRVTVSGPGGSPIKKANLTLLNNGGRKITSIKTNTKGKKQIWVASKNNYYIRAKAKGYQYYTIQVKPDKNKKKLLVDIWLEKK